MTLYENDHLSAQALRALLDGSLSARDLDEVCAHTAACETCAARLADAALAQPRQAPAGFGEAVRQRIERSRERQRAEFRSYCLRVAVSAAASLVLIAGSLALAPQKISARTRPEPPAVTYPAAQDTAPPAPNYPAPGSTGLPALSQKLTDTWSRVADLFTNQTNEEQSK